MSSRRPRVWVGAIGLLSGSLSAANGAYLLALLGGCLRPGKPAQADQQRAAPRMAVTIPAHDEASQVASVVASVAACAYPLDRRRLVVLADNCSDATAEVARLAGAEVWERHDPERRGKGHALAWAFERVLADATIDAVCVVDADCEVSPDLLSAFAARLNRGAEAVQARYVVSNPGVATAAALRWAGFALVNVVRPMGRDRLGASSGLLGTGMAFSRDLLQRSPWRAISFAEDREQHMRWVLDGVRVVFADEAEVRAPAATNRRGEVAQQRRWESGRVALLRRLTPRLMLRFIRAREFAALDAGLEPLLMPQSLLAGLNLLAAVTAAIARLSSARRLATFGVVAQVTFILGGLSLAGAPASVWLALLRAPVFVGSRMRLLITSAVTGGPGEWERTTRPDGT